MSLSSYNTAPNRSGEKNNVNISPVDLSDECDSDASTRTCTISQDYTPGRPVIAPVRDSFVGVSMLNRTGSDASTGEDSDDEMEEEKFNSPKFQLDRTPDQSNVGEQVANSADRSAINSATRSKMPPLFSDQDESATHDPDIIDVMKKMEQLTLKVDSLQKEVNLLRAENAAVKEDQQDLRLFVDSMLEIVPSDPEFFEKSDVPGEFLLEWTNKLKAQCDIQGYNIGLENGVFRIKAPQQRAVLSHPFDGQVITIQAIQSKGATGGPKTNKPSKFVFKMPNGKENVVK